MNEAPATVFGLILDAVETRMQQMLPPDVDEISRLSAMQHAIAADTVLSLVPLCAGSCEHCHDTARGVILLSAAAVRALEQRVLELMAQPEYQVAVADFMKNLRERLGSVGTQPGALSHADLVELGVVDEASETGEGSLEELRQNLDEVVVDEVNRFVKEGT